MLFMRIQSIAKLILQTPSTSMMNSTIASDLIEELNQLSQAQSTMIVGNADAEDLLIKLMYLFAPVARLATSLVGHCYSSKIFSKHD